jgi:hypothetical protein
VSFARRITVTPSKVACAILQDVALLEKPSTGYSIVGEMRVQKQEATHYQRQGNSMKNTFVLRWQAATVHSLYVTG